MRSYIGIDNGISGSVSILSGSKVHLFKTPIKKCLEYTKEKQYLNRLDCLNFISKLKSIFHPYIDFPNTLAVIERPMVNVKRWKSTKSALRCFEATLICLETLFIPYVFIDSKEWQRYFFQGRKKDDLKNISKYVGIRRFPKLEKEIIVCKDADALLIAEYARRNNW